MIFVDSSVWIDYINGSPTPQAEELDRILGIKPIIIGDLVLTEVLQGCSDPKTFKEVAKLLGLADFVVVGGRDVAIQAARNYITLRTKGVTIRKTIDTFIATRCIVDGYELLHNDPDFLPFEQHLGLKCVI
ncbi:MAG TPA: VapC toxin family PIN domain ribonuclease [Blastocatellia bacterium]|nr:VapC toxin family PIN domain ribonuclease [Blastocatellia bacterium]